MQIGDFEITDNGSNFHVKYVGKPGYLTTASPNNHSWVKELLNKWYGRHEFVYKAPPLEFKQIPREKLDELIRNSRLPDEVLPLSYVRTIIFKKEKETAMEKDMKDYIGCYLKEVEFKPPYTTILWSDGTATQVKCIDEPYDPEKGFAMAVQKKLFGRNYYKHMESIIKRDGGYEKATPLIRIMDDYRGYLDSPIERELTSKNEEIEKLKKENDRLLTEVNTLDAVRYGIVKTNEELKKENNNLEKMLKEFSDNKEELCARLARTEMLYRNQCAVIRSLNGRIDDLKKAKENMAKKLAETKQLKKDLDAQMLKNGELDRENQKLRRDAEIKSNLIDRQREDIHRLKEWFRREAEKVSNLQRRNDTQAESIHTLLKENKTLKISIEQINQIKEILK